MNVCVSVSVFGAGVGGNINKTCKKIKVGIPRADNPMKKVP